MPDAKRQRSSRESSPLLRFLDRVTRRLSEDDAVDVMVEEFLVELKADRVAYVAADEGEDGWTFAVCQEAAAKGVACPPVPYIVSEESEELHDFLESAVAQSTPVTCSLPDSFDRRAAMACAVECPGEGKSLFCVQRREAMPWTATERALFSDLCRFAASLLEQARLAGEIRDLKDEFSSLIESMPSAIVGVDLLGTVAMWNGKAEEIFGLDAAAMTGRVFWESIPEFTFVEEGIRRILRMEPGSNLDFDLQSYRTGDGRQLYLRAALFTLFGSDRGEVALRIDDVTHAEELRQKLALSQRRALQGALLEAAGHELQNLLTAAQGRLWLLEQNLAGSPEVALKTEFDALRAVTDRASSSLGRLLALSGEPPAGRERFELREAAREAVELCRRSFGPSVAMLLREEDGVTTLDASRHQAEQAILNALLHAHAGIRDGGALVARLQACEPPSGRERGSGWIRLGIEASGGGDAAPEAQASSLGWTVARALVEQCGGIAAEESASGGSRSFHLVFPLAGSAAPGGSAASEPIAHGRGRVWVIQADASPRETALSLLRKLGYEPEGYADGASAVHRLESGAAPDLAVIDWDLPMLGGKDAAAVLRSMRPGLKLIFTGLPAKLARSGIPGDAVLLPRFHRIQEFAAAVRDAMGPFPPG